MPAETTTPKPAAYSPPAGIDTRFVNGMRLDIRLWLAVALFVSFVVVIAPRLWKKIERFDTGPDYRIPYDLSKDYWLYEGRLQRTTLNNIALIGDSVIWGEYVQPVGTLSHFLNEQSGQAGKFVNAGVNGLFPLALEGLLRHYGEPLSGHKVILHCNVLWLSSPKADLQTSKEERFNHADLVPQFYPRIPCYKANLNRRLAAVVKRHFAFSQWANHLQVTYFGQKNMLAWTLAEDNSDPPGYPNASQNPLTQITLEIPAEPIQDPDRGPASARHKPWSVAGQQGTTRFEWVEADRSLQWAAFQRSVQLLQARGNDVLVLVGPFNEYMMAEESRLVFRKLRDDIAGWLAKNGVPHVVPATLPSLLYADASHPLTDGYRQLARAVWSDARFRDWLNQPANH